MLLNGETWSEYVKVEVQNICEEKVELTAQLPFTSMVYDSRRTLPHGVEYPLARFSS